MISVNCFFVIYVIVTFTSLIVTIYNYMTKYEIWSGDKLRVYTHGGLVLRCFVSFVPLAHIYTLAIAVFEPIDTYFIWHDIRTDDICRRSKFAMWVEKTDKQKKIN